MPSTSRPARREPGRRRRPGRGHVGLVVLPQHVERAHHHGPAAAGQRHLEPAAHEAQPGPLQRAGGGDAAGVDLDADDLDVGPHAAQPLVQLDGGHRGGAVAEVDDDRRRPCAAQPPRLRAGEPAVAPAEAVGVRRAAGDDPDGALGGHRSSLGRRGGRRARRRRRRRPAGAAPGPAGAAQARGLGFPGAGVVAVGGARAAGEPVDARARRLAPRAARPRSPLVGAEGDGPGHRHHRRRARAAQRGPERPRGAVPRRRPHRDPLRPGLPALPRVDRARRHRHQGRARHRPHGTRRGR